MRFWPGGGVPLGLQNCRRTRRRRRSAGLASSVLASPASPLLQAALGPSPAVTVRRVRLAAGASPREGRVELLAGCEGNKSAEWYGNLCQLDVWYRDSEYAGVNPDNLARVVCRELGFGGGLQKRFRVARRRPQLAGKVVCTGGEAAVADCAGPPDGYGRL